MHVHDLVPFKSAIFDTSHRIDKLSFGKPYPGIKNPLPGITVPRRNSKNPEGKPGAYQYFLKVKRGLNTRPRLVTGIAGWKKGGLFTCERF